MAHPGGSECNRAKPLLPLFALLTAASHAIRQDGRSNAATRRLACLLATVSVVGVKGESDIQADNTGKQMTR